MAENQAFAAEWLAGTIAQAPLGVGVVEVAGLRVLAANDRLAFWLGCGDARGAIGVSLPQPEDGGLASHLAGLIRAAVTVGSPAAVEIMVGSTLCIEARAASLRNPDGDIHAVALFLADVTERRQNEDALRESETKAWAAIASAVEGVIIIDADGVVESLNPAAAHIFGYLQEEVIGRNVSILMPEPFRSQHTAFIHRYLETGEAHVIGIGRDVVGQRKDGSTFPMELGISEVCLPDHRHFVGLVRDITDRKQAEEALHAARRQAEEAYRRELRIAQRFQSALLPGREVRVPGYAIAHSYRPALEEADVGGDFYNLFAIDERLAGVVVGDVGGKGLEAAVLAARAQHAIMALALQDPLRPDRVLEAARLPVSTFDPDRILTVFLGILDRDTGALICSSAGHEPPFIWRAREKRLHLLPVDGPAMFGIPAGPYRLTDAILDEGDILFLYTDGLPDARRAKERLGHERVGETVAHAAASGPAAILVAAYRAAIGHSGGRLRDDIVLMAVERTGRACPEGISIYVSPPEVGEGVHPSAATSPATPPAAPRGGGS